MSFQSGVNRLLSNKVVYRILSFLLVGVLTLSVYMTGTLTWTSYVNVTNSFYGGSRDCLKGLIIQKNLNETEDSQLTDEERENFVFSFLIEIPSITEPVEYTTYDEDDKVVSSGFVTPTGDINDPDSFIFLKGGQYSVLPDVLAGTWYRVSEITAPGFETDSMGSSGHVLNGGSTAEFTNTYYDGMPGILELRKSLNIDSSAEFDFDVRFELYGALYNGYITVSYDGGEPVKFENPGVVTLSSGGFARFMNLPPGVKYEITERDYTDDNYYPAAGTFSGFISSGCTPIVIDADNYFIDTASREKGSLSISKRVTGDTADNDKGFKFIVSFEDVNNSLYANTSGSSMVINSAGMQNDLDGTGGEYTDTDSEADSSRTSGSGLETDSTESTGNGSDLTEADPSETEEPDADISGDTPEDTENKNMEPASPDPDFNTGISDENILEVTVSESSEYNSSDADKEEVSETENADLATDLTDSENMYSESGSAQNSEAFTEVGSNLVVNDLISRFYSEIIFDEPLYLSSSALDITEFYPEFISDGSVRSSVDSIDNNAYYITLYPGETAKFDNIPEGLKYTVTEVIDEPIGYIPSTESVSGIIIGLIDKSIEFVNHKPDNIALRVKKIAVDEPDEDIDKVFTVWLYINNIKQEPPIKLKSGEVSSDIDIPVGAYYDVVEEDYANEGYLTYVEHASGIAISNRDVTATITNYYLTEPDKPTPSPSQPTDTDTPTPSPSYPADTGTPTPSPSQPAETDTPTPAPTYPAGTDTPTPGPTTSPDYPTSTPYPTNSPYYPPLDPPYNPQYVPPAQPPTYNYDTPTPTLPFAPTTMPIYTPTPTYPDVITEIPVYGNTVTPTPNDVVPPESTPPSDSNPPGQIPAGPQTGDPTNPAPWFVVMVLSAVLLRYILLHKSKLLAR